MFSQIKDRKHIEQNFHSVVSVMPRGGTSGRWGGGGGVKTFSVGICDGAPSTARSSYVVADLLFMYFPLFVGVLYLSLFGMHYFVSFLVFNHLEEEARAGCFAFVVLRMSCYCICSVSLPYGVVGWSAVCDCDIS